MLTNLFFSLGIIFLTLLLLVGFHELGHFLVAKGLGIKVIRFSIGFGKPLWEKKTASGTIFSIGAVPLGGYVKMLDQREGPVKPEVLHQAFDQQSLLRRVAVIVAGPLFNILFAIAGYWLVFYIGITQPIPIIAAIKPGSPAALAKVPTYSEIAEIDQRSTPTWGAVIFALIPHLGETNSVKIRVVTSSKQALGYTLPLKKWQVTALRPNLLESLGIEPWQPANKKLWPANYLRTRQYPLLSALRVAVQEVVLYLHVNMTLIMKLIEDKLSLHTLVGPIGIFSHTIAVAQQGLVAYVTFLSFLSVGLGFANLLPIPGLDGSHLLYLLIEKCRGGKAVSLRVQLLLFQLGVIFLSILLVQTLVYDTLRMIL